MKLVSILQTYHPRANPIGPSSLDSCPYLGYSVESTTGYTFTPVFDLFTSPDITTV